MAHSVCPTPSQRGRVTVVTGAAGLGFQTALELCRAGGDVVLAGRDAQKGEAATSAIRGAAPNSRIRFELLDLASLASASAFAQRLSGQIDRLDALICNAGIMSPPERRTTADGFELQFGVNHLGHFALTAHLLPLLLRSPASRVVSVTSLAQHYARIDFDDLQSERRYVPGKAYCVSKFAQASFAQELQRRSADAGWGLSSLAAHPGMARTDLFRASTPRSNVLKSLGPWAMGHLLGQSASAGAASIVYAATSPNAEGGQLYGPTGPLGMKGAPGVAKFAKASSDPQVSRRLWAASEALLGVSFPTTPAR